MYSHQRSKVTRIWKNSFVECRLIGGKGGLVEEQNSVRALFNENG